MRVKSFLYFVAKITGIRAGDLRRQADRAMMRCQLVEQKNIAICKLSKSY